MRPHEVMLCIMHWFFGSVPTLMSPQTPSLPAPLAALLHAWHAPLQAMLQQKPSVQKPLEHWSVAVHAWPFACWVVHTELLQ